MEQLFVDEALSKTTGTAMMGIEIFPQDLKLKILAFLEKDSLYSMSEVSRSWNILVLELLKIQVKNLSQEEFSRRFAYSVFENDVRDFNFFKKILEGKDTSLRPEFYWVLKEEEMEEEEIEDYSKNNKGKQRIGKYEDDDTYFGMSMLYAAIQEHANPDMAIYLVQKMKETEKGVEYENYTMMREENENENEITSWAYQWPNLGYANGAHVTPLTMAVLNALDWEKKGYFTEKKNKFEVLSKLLISHGGTIQTFAYHEDIFEESCWLPRKALFIALEEEKKIIETMHQEALQKLQAENQKLKEENATLLELQAENQKLKKEIETLSQSRKKNLFSGDGQNTDERLLKRVKHAHAQDYGQLFFTPVAHSQSENSITPKGETLTAPILRNSFDLS